MTYNEAETHYFLIDPILREKSYDDSQWLKPATPAPVESTGAKGDRVEIRGLYAFNVKQYDGYKGRNPKTGESVKVKPK